MFGCETVSPARSDNEEVEQRLVMDIRPRDLRVFNETDCTRCGDCFHRCPELKLPRPLAVREIAELIAGRTDGRVLAHCTTCFSCNHYCPHDCKPYQLILERWNDLYKRRQAPPIYRFVCPNMDGNIWHMLGALMRPEESAWIRAWTTRKPKGTLLLIGSYVHLFPFVIGNSRLLDHFTPVDFIEHWECGAYLYQGGYLDVVKAIGEKCRRDLQDPNIDAVVPLIDSVYWMMTRVLPEEMDVHLEAQTINFHAWLIDKIRAGEITFRRQLKLTVTVHDNCYAKAGGTVFWDRPRDLLRLAGCDIREMAHIREDARCCGFGAGASWVKPITILYDIMDVARQKLEEAEATGADALVSYCGGCLYLLWTAKVLFDKDIDIYHLVEIQRLALGENLCYPHDHVRRAWDIITIITYHSAMSLWGRPFRIRTDNLDGAPPAPRPFRLLKFTRRILDVPPVQFLFKKGFAVLVRLLKSRRDWERRGNS